MVQVRSSGDSGGGCVQVSAGGVPEGQVGVQVCVGGGGVVVCNGANVGMGGCKGTNGQTLGVRDQRNVFAI